MKFGIVLCGTGTSWQQARHAEARGFDSIWYWDSPSAAGDPFMAAALTAHHVPRIRIGFAVYVPWPRSAIVTASAMATLNSIAPGRIDLCYGSGFTSRRCLGLPPMKLKDMYDHAVAVRDLLEGQEARLAVAGAAGHPSGRLLHPHLFNMEDEIRYHIAASGPKGRSLVADFGAGWLDAPGIFDPGLEALKDMQSIWAGSRSKTRPLRTTLLIPTCLRETAGVPDEDVLARVGPFAMAAVHYWVDEHFIQGKALPDILPAELRHAVEAYGEIIETRYGGAISPAQLHTGHCLYVRADERHLVTDALINTTIFSAPADELRGRMERIASNGVHEVLFPILPDDYPSIDALARALGLS